jgi:hypothetical protein
MLEVRIGEVAATAGATEAAAGDVSQQAAEVVEGEAPRQP